MIVSVIYVVLYLKKKMFLKKIENTPFDPALRVYLKKIVHYKNLSDHDKRKIEKSIQIFSSTKEFIGVDIMITDEIKTVIAFYACLLLLKLEDLGCYEDLKTIIVYPSPVVINKIKENNGIFQKEDFVIDGQSSSGTVIIVWNDAKSEAYHLTKNNLIIHEFAHEIDFMDGEIDGVPPMQRSKYLEWTSLLYKEFSKLQEKLLRDEDFGKYKILGAYAGTNEAEFFAVLSERFFESPKLLKKDFPQLYEKMYDFYKIDTLSLSEKKDSDEKSF